jgi:superfamily II DNA or RNA helicase
MIKIVKKNEVYLRIDAEPHVHKELSDYFTFEVPEAKFMKKNDRYKYWDGKIRLYSPGTGEMYVGLFDYLIEWLNERNYQYEIQDSKFYGHPEDTEEFVTPESVVAYMKTLGLPFKARDYQLKAIYEALKNNRRLLLSPTASGKSLIIYGLVRWHVERDRNILIIVPTTSLVEQLYKDFIDYGWKADAYCHKIYSGKEKWVDAQVVISTWQSIYKEPKRFFDRYDAIIGDEAHLFKAKSLTSILTKLHDCKYRIGLTGTLDGTHTNKLVLEGLFGKCNRIIKTKELQEKGYLANLKVNILVMKHGYVKHETYQDEIDYIISHEKRNNLIKNLACDISGNTLILFSYVERHGEVLYEMINNKVKNKRKVFFIHGGVETELRESARAICENEEDAIIIASYGTFSTGINIRNLHNVIFASPSKSRVRNLQSIGRVLRKGNNKTEATLYDIADDMSKENFQNYTLKHLIERIKIYNEEKFNYEITEIKLK